MPCRFSFLKRVAFAATTVIVLGAQTAAVNVLASEALSRKQAASQLVPSFRPRPETLCDHVLAWMVTACRIYRPMKMAGSSFHALGRGELRRGRVSTRLMVRHWRSMIIVSHQYFVDAPGTLHLRPQFTCAIQ